MESLIVFAALLLVCIIVLPIVAIIRTRRISVLENRVAGLEAALLRMIEQKTFPTGIPTVAPAPPVEQPIAAPSPPQEQPVPEPTIPETAAPEPVPALLPNKPPQTLEAVIGTRWIGWIAIILIFFAAAFFFKYAVENDWIGELGRITLGVITGVALASVGLNRYRKGWFYLSQVLTAGGIIILYLSVYGAFAYYHLIDQRSAFGFLALIVIEAGLLAATYNAPAIAVMAIIGGFLVPILLSTGRDQYVTLFTYIGLIDIGVIALVMARRWRVIASLAYVGTQLLFWGWYSEHYHPEKRIAVFVFQAAIFLLFAAVDLAPHLRGRMSGIEEQFRLAVNPFVFFATCYGLFNAEYHEWMAVLALVMAIVYASLARLELNLPQPDKRMMLITVGTALTFVTLAIPIQLNSNWITIAWSVEALALSYAGLRTSSTGLRALSAAVFFLAFARFITEDTPWAYRPVFTPVFNRYFLGMLVLAGCLGITAYLHRNARGGVRQLAMITAVAALGLFWIGSSFETYTYFGARATRALQTAQADNYEVAKQLRWTGQLSLSLLWCVYAGTMMAIGFRRQVKGWRVAGLVLFGITLFKVGIFDISELRELPRILAVLALGLVLLAVAWKYQRGLRREQTP